MRPTPPPAAPARRRGVLRLASLVVGLQLVAFCLLLSRMPSLSSLSSARRVAATTTSSISSLRRCLPLSGRDSRFALPGQCATAQQRLAVLEALLRVLTEALEAENAAYWLDGGALLGQFRAESLVIWDAHVRIGVLSAGKTLLQTGPGRLVLPPSVELNVVESVLYTSGELGEHGDLALARLVDTRFGFYVSIFSLTESEGAWPSVEAEDGESKVKLLVSDASTFWSECVNCRRVDGEEKKANGANRRRARAKVLVVPEEWVLPLGVCMLNDLQVLCPARAELYLAHEFGDGNF